MWVLKWNEGEYTFLAAPILTEVLSTNRSTWLPVSLSLKKSMASKAAMASPLVVGDSQLMVAGEAELVGGYVVLEGGDA